MSVLPKLLGRFEELVIDTIVVVLAFVRCVCATDLRTSVVCTASMIFLEMFAVTRDQQIPGFTVDEDGERAVHQVPANVIKLFPRLRRINPHCEVAAASSRAVTAQHFAGFEIFSSHVF